MELRHRQQIGTIPRTPDVYGESVLGAPLSVWRPASDCRVLVFAAIHGEEPESTIVLSRALRHLTEPSPHCAVVLAVNPDGLALGTRGNAGGVDLNRNFPASNWQGGPVCHRATLDDPRDTELSPGSEPASEPETRALIALIEELAPHTVIAMHAPLDCVEDPHGRPLGRWLSDRTGIPLVDDVGYATPGSFGSWAEENDVHEITFELPDASPEAHIKRCVPAFVELLTRTDL